MSLTLTASTSPQTLADFYAMVTGTSIRGGITFYTIKIRVNRDNEWVAAGILELYEDEWRRLYAVLNTHKAALHGNPVPPV